MNKSTIDYLHSRLPRSLYYFLAELYLFPRQLLRVSFVRFLICYVRKIYFINITKRIKTLKDDDGVIGKNTVMHNLKGIADLAVRRSQNLIFPTVIINRVVANLKSAKVLSIGPRAEGEIYNLIGHGFSSQNITGLDLISYSPYVKNGDMHDIPFDKDSFDVIFSGWVLSYSNDRQKAADEMLRVAKNAAVIAIGASYNPMTKEELFAQDGYLTGTDEKIRSAEEILALFGSNVENIYFKQTVEDPSKFCDMIVVFSVSKKR